MNVTDDLHKTKRRETGATKPYTRVDTVLDYCVYFRYRQMGDSGSRVSISSIGLLYNPLYVLMGRGIKFEAEQLGNRTVWLAKFRTLGLGK